MTAFFDTNILVYAFANEEPKRDIAQRTLVSRGVISVQVLNEFANVLRKKQHLEWGRIQAALVVVESWFQTAMPLTLETHRAALALAREHSVAFYDALIISSALEADCDTLYSEDLQHGRRFHECVIVNPFRDIAPR